MCRKKRLTDKTHLAPAGQHMTPESGRLYARRQLRNQPCSLVRGQSEGDVILVTRSVARGGVARNENNELQRL